MSADCSVGWSCDIVHWVAAQPRKPTHGIKGITDGGFAVLRPPTAVDGHEGSLWHCKENVEMVGRVNAGAMCGAECGWHHRGAAKEEDPSPTQHSQFLLSGKSPRHRPSQSFL